MIQFLINNKQVELTESVSITLNATNTDFTTPTAIKVSYSKTIEIEGTQNNNKLFSNLYRLDSSNMLDFDTSVRNDAVILNNGALIDSGYVTLDKITIKNGTYRYSVTFYSLLGQFFYNLKYNNNAVDEDEEKTLYDLYYGFEVNNHTLTQEEENNRVLMHWTKDYIVDSWNELFNPSKKYYNYLDTKDIRHLVTAAATYSGHYADFDNNKVMSSNPNDSLRQSYGIEASKWNTSKEYTKDYMIFEAPRDLDEHEVCDLRSLYQRPAIKVKAILDAISNPINNGGFNVEWPKEIYTLDNPLGCYYNLTWLITDRFSFEDYTPKTEKALEISQIKNNNYSYITFDGDVTTDTTTMDSPMVQVALNVNIPYPDNIEVKDYFYLQHNWWSSAYKTNYQRFTSVIEYDFYYNNTSHRFILCDKKPIDGEDFRRNNFPTFAEGYFNGVTFLETKFINNTIMKRFINETKLIINLPDIPKVQDLQIRVQQKIYYGIASTTYTEMWVNENETQTFLNAGWNFVLVEYSADDETELLPDKRYEGEAFLYRMYKYISDVGKVENGIIWPNTSDKQETDVSFTKTPFGASVYTLFDNNAESNYISILYDTIKSMVQNTAVDKKILFQGSRTPLDYLLNFTKLLNLKFIYDKLSNTIKIVPNSQYYTNRVVNIENKIDRSGEIAIKPNYWGSKVFKYQLPPNDSYVKYLYEKKSNKEFLTYMYNTNNFVLNGTNEVLNDFVFNSVMDFNQQSVYYNEFNTSVLTKGNKWNVELFKADSNEQQEVWFNKNNKTLDNISKLCLFDNDNGALTNTINFVFLNTCIYHQYNDIAVSDNWT